MTSVVALREPNAGLQVGRRERARGRDPFHPEKNKLSIRPPLGLVEPRGGRGHLS